MKSLFKDLRNFFRISKSITVFYKGFRGTADIRLLKDIRSEQTTLYLSRNHNKRNAVRKGSRNPGNYIGRSGTGGHGTNSGFSADSGIAVCFMCRILLRTNQDTLYICTFQAVKKRTNCYAGITENIAYFFQLQTLDNRICSSHLTSTYNTSSYTNENPSSRKRFLISSICLKSRVSILNVK